MLPTGPAEAIRLAQPILERWWSRDLFFLGGGTALAARWEHRHSTDVDLFIDSVGYGSVYRSNGEEMTKIFASMVKDGEVSSPTVNSGYLKFATSHGSVSLFTTEPVVEEARVKSSDREVETQIALESTEEILAKKLVRRIWGNGVFVSRDAYDIVIAAAYEPDALDVARSELLEIQRIAICDRFRELSRSGLETKSELLGATYPNIAIRSFYFANKAIEGEYEEILREVAG